MNLFDRIFTLPPVTKKQGKQRMIYRKLILIFVLGVLCGCLPSEQSEPEIIHAKLGTYELYIPKAYVKFRHTSIGNESALLQAWYPGSAIVPGDSSIELSKQGVWWKNVRILASKRNSTIPFDEFARKSTKYLDATEIVANEYGLIHYKQPAGYVQDKYDVWFEKVNGEIVSYITCTEQLTSTSVPQCSHEIFVDSKLWLKVSYDRRLLPEWKLIKTNVEDMFKSFQTPRSAREFIHLRMQELETQTEGDE